MSQDNSRPPKKMTWRVPAIAVAIAIAGVTAPAIAAEPSAVTVVAAHTTLCGGGGNTGNSVDIDC
ncbi:hypothetical protein PV458_35090 [Streptomyces sp. MN03-5084-2B]|nr:hypothetical protein [Streptomyces sp. MN03-5084-2B]